MTNDQLMQRVDLIPIAGCWLWNGHADKDGYGYLTIGGRYLRAHRVFYAAFVGPIPSGALVCHRCDTRLCMNPAHLFTGTIRDNNRDMVAKNRHAKGAQVNNTKLCDADARTIKSLSGTAVAIAHRFGVSDSTVRRIRSGQYWKHV